MSEDNEKFTIEQHGAEMLEKYVLYFGRSQSRHGFNLMTITEVDPVRVDLLQRIPDTLNACEGMSPEDLNEVIKIGNVGRMIDLTADLIKKNEREMGGLKRDLADAESRLKTAAEMIGVLFNGGKAARKLKKASWGILDELNKTERG